MGTNGAAAEGNRSMEVYDPSSAVCLRQLLEEQVGRLRVLSARLGDVYRTTHHTVGPDEWSGRARDAHDGLLHRIQSNLAGARSALDAAADASARAAMTLVGRVG